MTRILLLVEGETEETFVNQLLAPHLYDKGFTSVSVKLMGNQRQRSRRGGIRAWAGVRKEIIQHLTRDADIFLSVMADYYALPADQDKAWPGRVESENPKISQKSQYIENELIRDIKQGIGESIIRDRFIPYIMMHEFEGLLFSDCQVLAKILGQKDLANKFQNIRNQFSSPEEINDSPDTHPSKRIRGLVRRYQKISDGNRAAKAIGLEVFRQECPNFRRWLEKLESLPQVKNTN